MRYRRGHISLADTNDIPLLLTIRNARAITYDQICSLARIDGIAGSKRIVHWRLSTLGTTGSGPAIQDYHFLSPTGFFPYSLGRRRLAAPPPRTPIHPPTPKETRATTPDLP